MVNKEFDQLKQRANNIEGIIDHAEKLILPENISQLATRVAQRKLRPNRPGYLDRLSHLPQDVSAEKDRIESSVLPHLKQTQTQINQRLENSGRILEINNKFEIAKATIQSLGLPPSYLETAEKVRIEELTKLLETTPAATEPTITTGTISEEKPNAPKPRFVINTVTGVIEETNTGISNFSGVEKAIITRLARELENKSSDGLVSSRELEGVAREAGSEINRPVFEGLRKIGNKLHQYPDIIKKVGLGKATKYALDAEAEIIETPSLVIDSKGNITNHGIPVILIDRDMAALRYLAENKYYALATNLTKLVKELGGNESSGPAINAVKRIRAVLGEDSIIKLGQGVASYYRLIADVEIHEPEINTESDKNSPEPKKVEGQETTIPTNETGSMMFDRHDAAIIASLLALRNGAVVRNRDNKDIFTFKLSEKQLSLISKMREQNFTNTIRIQQEDLPQRRARVIELLSRMMADENIGNIDMQQEDVRELLTETYYSIHSEETLATHFAEFLIQPVKTEATSLRGVMTEGMIKYVKLVTNGNANHSLEFTAPSVTRPASTLSDVASHPLVQSPTQEAVRPITNPLSSFTISPEQPEPIIGSPAPEIRDVDVIPEPEYELEKVSPTDIDKQVTLQEAREELVKLADQEDTSPFSHFKKYDRLIEIRFDEILQEIFSSKLTDSSSGALVVREFNNVTHKKQENMEERGISQPIHEGGGRYFSRADVALMIYDQRFGRNSGIKSQDWGKIRKAVQGLIDEAEKEKQRQEYSSK